MDNSNSGGSDPNLFSLYGQSLDPAAEQHAALYENPVVDNVADFSTHGTGQPFDFYDPFQGPLSGRGQPASPDNMRQPQAHEKMAQLLLAKMQEKQQTSQQFQQSAQTQNKQNAGPSGY